MTERRLDRDDVRHLLRRLDFAATPARERALQGLTSTQAFDAVWSWNDAPPSDEPGSFSREASVALLRQHWLAQMVASPAGLRDSLALFVHGLHGSSSQAVKNTRAIAARHTVSRRVALTSVPGILRALVSDPSMMVQIGMSGHGIDRASDRPAVLVLDHWTVGRGAYDLRDVEALSRALTGWTVAASGAAEFREAEFDAGPKTILGTTQAFSASTAIEHLARHPLTARRWSRSLIRHFGITDPEQRLQRQMEEAWASTEGSIRELLRVMVSSEEFWSSRTRWSLIKSPVHLAVAACRQLELQSPPLVSLDRWLAACGQTLFDTPNNGEGGWADQEAWISPADRLALRYQLPQVLTGAEPRVGLVSAIGDAPASPAARITAAVRDVAPEHLIARLDPAPGLSVREVRTATARAGGRAAELIVRHVMSTPHYQLA